MLQLQLGKRPTTVSQPKVGAGFLPPQTCLGFSWSVGHSEGHCSICIFLKFCFCVKPLPQSFPSNFFPVFFCSKVFFSWLRHNAKSKYFQIWTQKGGHATWSILPSPISSTFTNVHFYPHLTLCILFLLFLLSISTFNERLSDSCK